MDNLRITQSVGLKAVGIRGRNKPDDIKAVQISLNKLLCFISPTELLAVDGSLGPKPESSETVKAISRFQKKVLGMIRPDGTIDVNGKTHRKINEKLKARLDTSTSIAETLKHILRKKLEKYEGRVEHMYLDTRGFVTVGVGHMMSSATKAKQLSFIVVSSGAAASKEEIADEYALIKSKPYGKSYPAHTFKKYTKLKLSDSVINKVTNKHITSFEGELKRIYGATEFKAHPKNVKLALFDMIFNLGMSKLKNKYPKFNKYMKANDYKNAASESERKGIGSTRNLYVKNLLSKPYE